MWYIDGLDGGILMALMARIFGFRSYWLLKFWEYAPIARRRKTRFGELIILRAHNILPTSLVTDRYLV